MDGSDTELDPGGSGGPTDVLGIPTTRGKRNRKVRETVKYDKAQVALLAGRHVPEAIRTIAELMKSATREQVRLRASTTLVELACELEPDAQQQGAKVYVLATAPDAPSTEKVDTAALAAELRKRLKSGDT